MLMKYILLFFLFLSNLFAIDAFIPPSKLNAMLQNNEKVVLLDVSSRSSYDTSHIYGALHADIEKFINKTKFSSRYEQNLQAQLNKLGINDDSKVVLYARNSIDDIQNTTLLAFILSSYGVKNISILDGGYMSWIFEDFHVASQATKIKTKGNFVLKKDDSFTINAIEDQNSSSVFIAIQNEPETNSTQTQNMILLNPSFYEKVFYKDFTLREDVQIKEALGISFDLDSFENIVIKDDSIARASFVWYLLHKKFSLSKVKIVKKD